MSNKLSTFADLGAGKSYLGFILYDLWLRTHESTRLFAVEPREDLVLSCQKIANDSHFDRISFVQKSILDALNTTELPESVDVVTALHACDTATDEAIAFAIKKQATVVALVPCCQAEVARLLEGMPLNKAHEILPLWRHGIHKREMGSHLTNVIRALFLESHGYKVRVTELIGWEHSMKNELILAHRVQKSNGAAQRQLESLLAVFPLKMKLLELDPNKT